MSDCGRYGDMVMGPTDQRIEFACHLRAGHDGWHQWDVIHWDTSEGWWIDTDALNDQLRVGSPYRGSLYLT